MVILSLAFYQQIMVVHSTITIVIYYIVVCSNCVYIVLRWPVQYTVTVLQCIVYTVYCTYQFVHKLSLAHSTINDDGLAVNGSFFVFLQFDSLIHTYIKQRFHTCVCAHTEHTHSISCNLRMKHSTRPFSNYYFHSYIHSVYYTQCAYHLHTMIFEFTTKFQTGNTHTQFRTLDLHPKKK